MTQCRIKVGDIDAAALGPFVKQAHGVDEKFFLYFLVAHSWRQRLGGVSQQAAACSHLNIFAAKHTDC